MIERERNPRPMAKNLHHKQIMAFLTSAVKRRALRTEREVQSQSPQLGRQEETCDSIDFEVTSRLAVLELDIFNISIERRELRDKVAQLKQRLTQSTTMFQAKQQIFLGGCAKLESLHTQLAATETFLLKAE